MDVFAALAEPTRRSILELLAEGGQLAASDIYKKFSSSPPAISQHLKVLREAKLVRVEKQAQKRLYAINADKLSELEDWTKKLHQLWSERFDRLDEVLASEMKKAEENRRRSVKDGRGKSKRK